ncbi:hypothetical protein B7494_g2682 [Chlorociboria aeruginascens]|nr:hypothetical protein B7494_g2682 [Chlorociboria aeruginascens]
MATAETVSLGPAHEPKEESINAFKQIEVDLKRTLQHLRHDSAKHEREFFAAVENLSDKQLTNFSADDLKLVRVATSAYGIHLFGKTLLPEGDSEGGTYFMFRAFIPGEAENARLHCIHTQELEQEDGTKSFKAIFTENDPLEWFDT